MKALLVTLGLSSFSFAEKQKIREELSERILPAIERKVETGLNEAIAGGIEVAVESDVGQFNSSEFLKKEQERIKNPDPESVYADPQFLANYKDLLRKARRVSTTAVGVREATLNEYMACVAIGSRVEGGRYIYIGTGVLLSPKVVITAAHVAIENPELIAVCNNVNGRIRDRVNIQSIKILDYDAESAINDVALLKLEYNIHNVSFPSIADEDVYPTMKTTRVVGFGHNPYHEDWSVTQKRVADVPVASVDSRRESDRKYGSHPGKEFVASDPLGEIDTCNGDSGGPAYTLWQNQWVLVGITSRATDSSVKACGDGGIYVRVDAYRDEINRFIESNR